MSDKGGSDGASGMPPSYSGPIPEHQTPAYRAAKLAVIILSILIVLAVIALVVGGIVKLGGKHASSPAGAAAATFQLPPGARIVEMQSQPGRLILRVHSAAGEEIDILDTQDGRLVAQVKAGGGDAPR